MKTYRSCSVGKLIMILMTVVSLYSLPSFAQSTLTIDGVVLRDANLRAGPGVSHGIIGAARAGQLVTVTDYEGEWYQLSTGEWIAKFLVAATAKSRVVASDIPYTNFPVIGADPHGFDDDTDGIGCER